MNLLDLLANDISVLVQLVKKLLESPEVQALKWVLALAAVYYAMRLLLPTWRILSLSLYRDHPWSWTRSMLDLFQLDLLTLNREKWYRSARVRVEWELLQRRPLPPPRHHALRRRDGTHLETSAHARERFRDELQEYRESLHDWKSKLREHLTRFSRNEVDVVIDVDDVSQIYAQADDIRNYFGVLATDRSSQRFGADRFASRVRVHRGFIAPLHLLAGLLAECEEAWAPVIEDYGRQVAAPMPAARGARGEPVPFAPREAETRLLRLQTFLFDCWLLWGPSIPICTCEAWHGGRRILQFGFGDENNSLSLMFAKSLAADDLRAFFAAERVLGTALAVKVTGVTGVLQWGPSIPSSEVSLAQQSVCAPREDRLTLQVDDLPVVAAGSAEEGAARYYSAYLWAMFVICDEHDVPLHSDRKWRNLLPFFEHANIAEEQAFAMLKRQLVVKTLSSVLRLLHELPRLHLHLVCTIDESGCGSGLLCPPPAAESVRSVMHEIIDANAVFAELRQGGALASRLVLAADDWQDGAYSSCHLPEMIESYYRNIHDEPGAGDAHEAGSAADSAIPPRPRSRRTTRRAAEPHDV